MKHHDIFQLKRGASPLVISIPHLGTIIPDDIIGSYNDEALQVADTDWYLDRIYAFASDLGATVIAANISRYVVDLNRPSTGESLYPGMVTTSLCPLETFRGDELYRSGFTPDSQDVQRRIDTYWRPYHEALQQELARLRGRYANVLLWEAHSIASVLPRLFSGKLPDFNFGTSDGESCNEQVIASAIHPVRNTNISWVLNGRFKGGFITRKYGAPDHGVHAIQLEMSQSLYMDATAPFEWRNERASAVSPVIQACVESALNAVHRLQPKT